MKCKHYEENEKWDCKHLESCMFGAEHCENGILPFVTKPQVVKIIVDALKGRNLSFNQIEEYLNRFDVILKEGE